MEGNELVGSYAILKCLTLFRMLSQTPTGGLLAWHRFISLVNESSKSDEEDILRNKCSSFAPDPCTISGLISRWEWRPWHHGVQWAAVGTGRAMEQLWRWTVLCCTGCRKESLIVVHRTSPNPPPPPKKRNAEAFLLGFAVKVLRNLWVDSLAWQQHVSHKRTCSKHIILEIIQDGPLSFMNLFIALPHTFMSNFIRFLLLESPWYH